MVHQDRQQEGGSLPSAGRIKEEGVHQERTRQEGLVSKEGSLPKEGWMGTPLSSYEE